MSEDKPEEQQQDSCKEAQFLKANFAKLVARVNAAIELADDLNSKSMIHEETYSEITAEKTSEGKMRKLLISVRKGGDKVIKAFYNALRENEPYLFEELGGDVTMKRKLSDTECQVQAKNKKPNTENEQQFKPIKNDNLMAQPAPQYNVTNININEKPTRTMFSLNPPICPLPIPCTGAINVMSNAALIKPPVSIKKKKKPPAPKKAKKLDTPKKERRPIAPKTKKSPAPSKEKKTPAPKKEKKPPAPKKEKKPITPKKEKKPPAPKKEKKPITPKKEKKPLAPKKEKPPAPKKEKKPAAPKKEKKPPAPKKQKPPAPKKQKKPPAPKKQKKPPAPKK